MNKMRTLLICLLFLTSCSKIDFSVPPSPEIDCSDVLVYKHHYWSSIYGRFVYKMQWKRKDGTFYNRDASGSLYWSKVTGDRLCGN